MKARIASRKKKSFYEKLCANCKHESISAYLELQRHVSVRKVVTTLTSKSVEIYPSVAGAKQLGDTRFILVGSYVQQRCARGIVLRCTVVLVEGYYKRGGRGGWSSRSQRYCANIVVKTGGVCVCVVRLCPSLAVGGLPLILYAKERAVYKSGFEGGGVEVARPPAARVLTRGGR
jgi:hypothetical protein